MTATDQAAEMEKLREALEPVMHWYQSDEHEPRPLSEIVADIVADLQADRGAALKLAALASQPATGRTMGGEVFDQRPQCTSAKFGPEPSLRQMVRFYYGQHGQTDPDGDTEQYFAALKNGGVR